MPVTPEYKLLQMRQYLSGEPLRVIEKLGYSTAAYAVAKEKLERKYGGERRRVVLQFDEIEVFKPLSHNSRAHELEAFQT